MRKIRVLCPGVIAAFILLSCGPAPITPTGATSITGQWKWKSTVEIANNASAGCPLKTGDSATFTITIKNDGGINYTLTGFGVDSLVGTTGPSTGGGVDGELNFQGSYALGAGRKTDSASSVVSVEGSFTAMDGEEVWSWTGGSITCNGRSGISATKL